MCPSVSQHICIYIYMWRLRLVTIGQSYAIRTDSCVKLSQPGSACITQLLWLVIWFMGDLVASRNTIGTSHKLLSFGKFHFRIHHFLYVQLIPVDVISSVYLLTTKYGAMCRSIT